MSKQAVSQNNHSELFLILKVKKYDESKSYFSRNFAFFRNVLRLSGVCFSSRIYFGIKRTRFKIEIS
jgi:hypothetical protein